MFKGKFLLAAIVLAVSVVSSFSDTLPAFDADKMIKVVEERVVIGSLDTIGGTDSIKILKKGFKPASTAVREPGNYVLVVPAITGQGDDSVKYSIVTRSFSSNGVLMSSKVDSLLVKTGKTYLLPIGRADGVVGDNYEVVMKGSGTGAGGNGGQHIMTGLWVQKVVPIELIK